MRYKQSSQSRRYYFLFREIANVISILTAPYTVLVAASKLSDAVCVLFVSLANYCDSETVATEEDIKNDH